MCGRHLTRSGRGLLALLLGASIVGWSWPRVGRADEVRGADDEGGEPQDEEPQDEEPQDEEPQDEEPREDEGPSSPDAPPPTVDDTVEVVDQRPGPLRDAFEAPEAVFVERIDEDTPASATVADVLDDVPGVHVRRQGGALAPSFVRVRGSTARQVAIFVDGVPLNAFGSSAVDLSELALQAFDRVEVHRGFAPAHLGGASIGGAVNLITDLDGDSLPTVQGGFGSWLTRHVSASAGRRGLLPGGVGKVQTWLGYTGTRGDYRAFNDNGTLYNRADDRVLPRPNNHGDRLGGRLSLHARGGPVELTLFDLGSWTDGGVPGTFHARTVQARRSVVQNLVHGRAALTLHPAVRLEGGVGWRYRWELYEDLLGEVGVGRQDQRGHYHGVDADLAARLRPLPWLQVRPAVRLDVQTARAVDLLPERRVAGDRVRLASQLGADVQLRPLGDTLDIRGSLTVLVLDNRLLGAIPFSDQPIVSDGDEVAVDLMPGVAVAVRPAPWLTAHASLSRGTRPPGFLELFGDRGTVVGNATLRPERALSLDGGARLRGGTDTLHARFEVGGFARWTQDLIAFVPNAQRVSVPINLGATRAAGIETFAAVALPHVEFSGAVTVFPEARILAGEAGLAGNRIPNLPLAQVDVDVAGFYGEHVRLAWSFGFTSGSFDSPSNLFEQAPRPIHGLSLRLQPGPLWPWLSVDVDNLADTIVAPTFRNPHRKRDDDRAVVPLQDFRGHPLPGRSLMVSVGWTLDPPALAQQRAGAPRSRP